MAKLASLSPQNRKLASEIGVLLVILVIFIGFSIYTSTPAQPQTQITKPEPLNTEFNTEALEHVDQTDTTQPQYGGEVGKPNPFTY